MLVLRLFLYVALIAIVVTLAVYFLTGDRRYLKFCWQLLKFGLILVLVALVVVTMGRIILY